MAVKIRLKRFGTKNKPFYRVVAIDCKKPRDGETLDTLGYYHPRISANEKQLKEFDLNADKAKYWISVGAKPSDTVLKIFKKAGIIEK